jgi:TetR/AcrR family fatty acid metabolism transcriptional regulator
MNHHSVFIGGDFMASVRRASPPPRKSNGKYEAILRAAIKVFAGSGFFNSKVADVAREAGVADGTVYLYFKNKDDILASIFNHYGQCVAADGQDSPKSRPIEKLRRIVTLTSKGSAIELAVVSSRTRSSTKFMEHSATKVANISN